MKDSISHLHSVCEEWKKELRSFRSDIRILKKSLGDIVNKNPEMDILSQVDHFENKFDILEAHVHDLMHEVKTKDKVLMEQAHPLKQGASARMVDTGQNLEQQMMMIGKDFHDTRKAYQRFVDLVF